MIKLGSIIITAVLALLIMADVGSAVTAGHTHTLTVNGGSTATFTAGSTVRDTVTSDSSSGTWMRFYWRQDGDLLRTSDRTRDVNYDDSLTAITAGNWRIDVTEYDNAAQSLGESSTTFSVSPATEFGKLGVVMPLFAIGILYMSLRKRYL